MTPNSFFQTTFTGKSLNYARSTGKTGKLIDFGSGEVDQPVSTLVLSAVRRINSNDLVNYPDPSCQEIKKSIARRYGVGESMVTVGNGSDEIIENIPRVFLEPGDTCLFIVPTFFRFIESCQKMKGEIIKIATREEDKFVITPTVFTNIKTAIEKHQPKIIWVDSPNSVTGAVVPLKIINKIISWSKNIVVVDEVHHELAEPENRQSAVSLLPRHKNLIIIKSVSKAFGLAGVRLGFALAQKRVVAVMEKWRLKFAVNTVAQKVVVAALSDNFHIKRTAKSVKKQRTQLQTKIKKIPGFVIGAPSQTHLFILKHEKFDLFEKLIEKGILAADMRHVPGLENKGFVRLNIKTSKEAQLLLKALSDIYNENR